jgi:hypothetical protein
LDQDTIQQIESDFVNSRQIDATITAHHMHMWLVVARLLAQGDGSEYITKEHWNKSRHMDQHHRNRLAQVHITIDDLQTPRHNLTSRDYETISNIHPFKG